MRVYFTGRIPIQKKENEAFESFQLSLNGYSYILYVGIMLLLLQVQLKDFFWGF